MLVSTAVCTLLADHTRAATLVAMSVHRDRSRRSGRPGCAICLPICFKLAHLLFDRLLSLLICRRELRSASGRLSVRAIDWSCSVRCCLSCCIRALTCGSVSSYRVVERLNLLPSIATIARRTASGSRHSRMTSGIRCGRLPVIFRSPRSS